jgi:outer membrane lipoprotein carrier protein
VRIGFRAKLLSSVEVVDAFGQHSLLQFSDFAANVPVQSNAFVFTVPKGADLIEQ